MPTQAPRRQLQTQQLYDSIVKDLPQRSAHCCFYSLSSYNDVGDREIGEGFFTVTPRKEVVLLIFLL